MFLSLNFVFLLLFNNSCSDHYSLQFILCLDIGNLCLQMLHHGLNVFVRTQLPSVANRDAAQRTLLLALPVVGLYAVRAETMQATLVDYRAVHHLLTDRASQVLHHAFYELSAN